MIGNCRPISHQYLAKKALEAKLELRKRISCQSATTELCRETVSSEWLGTVGMMMMTMTTTTIMTTTKTTMKIMTKMTMMMTLMMVMMMQKLTVQR